MTDQLPLESGIPETNAERLRREWNASEEDLDAFYLRRRRERYLKARPVMERMAARNTDEMLVERGQRRSARGETIAEIALRAYTESVGFTPYVPRLNHEAFPNTALVLHLVPVPGSDSAWLGLWAFMNDARAGEIWSFGAFYPEHLPAGDIAAIKEAAASFGIAERNIQPWASFLKTFRKRTQKYRYRVPVVAWGLAAHLGRLAADWEAGTEGGIDLIVWTQPPTAKTGDRKRRPLLRNGETENPNRSRIHLDPIGGSRTRINYASRWRPDDEDRIPPGQTEPRKGYQFPGYFVDLVNAAYGLGVEDPALASAAAAYDIQAPADDGLTPVDIPGLMERAVAQMRVEATLYGAMLRDHESRGVAIHIHRLYSPGSYAGGHALASGVRPLLSRFPHFDRSVLGRWAGALHGGENRIGMLVPEWVPLPVTSVDFSSGYAATSSLIGMWRFMTARSIAVRPIDLETTRIWLLRTAVRVLRWMEDPANVPPLSHQDMERLAWTLLDVIPRSDVLAHRRRNGHGSAWRMQVGSLTHDSPVTCVALDVLRSICETGAIPEIVGGHRLVARGQMDGLKAMRLPDGTEVVPGDDLPLALAVARRRIAARQDLGPSQIARLVASMKLEASALASGLPAQMNRKKFAKKQRVRIWSHDGSLRTMKTDVVEEPGAWCFPPIGAAVTAGQRFLTFLSRGLVEAHGGHVVYIATDSLKVISTPDGAGLPCEGGPDIVADPETGFGVAGYKALSYAEVEAVRTAMEVYSPFPDDVRPRRTRWETKETTQRFGTRIRRRSYPYLEVAPSLLRLEAENFHPGPSWRSPAYVLALSPMRAYVYRVERGGLSMSVGPPPEVFNDLSLIDIEVLGASEQALGQLLPPPGEGPDWIERAADGILRQRLILPHMIPPAYSAPVMSLLSITGAEESKDHHGRYRRPWSLVVVLRSHPFFGPRREDEHPAIPTTIWKEGLSLEGTAWVDFETGEELAGLHVGQRHHGVGEQARVLTYGEVIPKHFSRLPERVIGPDGETPLRSTWGLLEPAPTEVSIVRLIGREMNLLDRAGITANPEYSDYTADSARRRLALEALRQAGAPRVQRASGLPGRTVRRFLTTGKTSSDRWAIYATAATRIATEDTAVLNQPLPRGDEGRWRLFLGAGRRCAGCGAKLTGKQRRWCSTCGR